MSITVMLFAFLAGLLTVLSPCVLPLLPIILTAASGEHRFGPVALAGGLALSFTGFGLLLSVVASTFDIDTGVFRQAGAILIIALGAVLMLPAWQTQLATAGGSVSSWAEQMFGAVGETLLLDERHMDAVTGLSASGPAFLYIVIEALADGGVKMGLPRAVALKLAAQTVAGAGAMVVKTGEHPAMLKDAVTTPSGTTIDGIMELEEGGVRVAMLKAVVRATRRATERAHELFGGTAK